MRWPNQASPVGARLTLIGVARRRVFFHSAKIERALLGGVCVLGVALANLALPAVAAASLKHKTGTRHSAHAAAEPFGAIPNGPLQIFISIDQQKLHLYSDGVHVADAPVATGVPAHPTPTGVFSVIDKERFHLSNIYSNAPMPYMQRITWSGVALHEGEGLGHPASHGCIRMPHDFATRLWVLTRRGARVIIARPELRPVDISDPHLFTHRELAPIPPPQPQPPPPTTGAVQTAQSIDTGKTTDVVQSAETLPPPAPPTPPDDTPAPSAGAQSHGDDPATSPEDESPHSDASNEGEKSEASPDDVAAKTAEPPESPEPPESAPSAPVTAPEKPAAAPTDPAEKAAPLPPPKPAVKVTRKQAPIAIFVSRKENRIYVRQKFSPLFDAPITIADRDRPLGTHVFTAMNYVDDGSTFRWTVVSLPGEPPRHAPKSAVRAAERHGKTKARGEAAAPPNDDLPPPDSPEHALARIEIPQDVIDRISALIVPGSSLVVSDQGLGDETGEGTDFIVIAR
jgi:hypothetical protein